MNSIRMGLFVVMMLVVRGSEAQSPNSNPIPDGAGDSAALVASLGKQLADRPDDEGLKGKLHALIGAPSPLTAELYEQARDYLLAASRDGHEVLVPAGEPGIPLIVSGTVQDSEGKPIKDALIYVYHTNKDGVYAWTGGNTASAGDSLHPRLFGYLRTGTDGRYEYTTIRPGGYPGEGPPAHVHYEVTAPGYRERITELMFHDDPRMTPEMTRMSLGQGFKVAKVKTDADGTQRCVCDIVMDKLSTSR